LNGFELRPGFTDLTLTRDGAAQVEHSPAMGCSPVQTHSNEMAGFFRVVGGVYVHTRKASGDGCKKVDGVTSRALGRRYATSARPVAGVHFQFFQAIAGACRAVTLAKATRPHGRARARETCRKLQGGARVGRRRAPLRDAQRGRREGRRGTAFRVFTWLTDP